MAMIHTRDAQKQGQPPSHQCGGMVAQHSFQKMETKCITRPSTPPGSSPSSAALLSYSMASTNCCFHAGHSCCGCCGWVSGSPLSDWKEGVLMNSG